MFKAMDMPNLSDSELLHKMVKGCIKANTSVPRSKTPTIPVKALQDMFKVWPTNEKLSIKDISLKYLCILAL